MTNISKCNRRIKRFSFVASNDTLHEIGSRSSFAKCGNTKSVNRNTKNKRISNGRINTQNRNRRYKIAAKYEDEKIRPEVWQIIREGEYTEWSI